MSAPNDRYDRIALAIGRVCYWWGAIELITRDMCHHIAAIYSRAFLDDTVYTPVYVLAENMDLRERIVALKTLACAVLPLKDFNGFEALLNRIDNEIRIERNRYVHDLWNEDEDGIYRMKMGTGVQREQAFKVRVRMLTEKVYGSIEEVEAFVGTVENAWRELIEFDSRFASLVPPASAQEQALQALQGKKC